ncbi:ankyrin [Penicillium malachiteum]|uniref:Ankyrin n=1 Tax=Penicillium malachiteum TaxID=1324776 RepID=A0AAD6MSB1_9EURO|nr:ankyrin [Penicillium malachiteum]
MSFGYSVGDLMAILKVADDLKKCSSQAPQQFKTISDDQRVWILLHDINDIPADGLEKQQEQDIQIIYKAVEKFSEI